MTELIHLPQELLCHILCYLKAKDVIHFARTCRRALTVIPATNAALWQSLFLLEFDQPADRRRLGCTYLQDVATRNDSNWYERLKQRRVAFRALHYLSEHQFNSISELDLNADDVADTLLDVIDTASGPQVDDPPQGPMRSKYSMTIDYQSSLNLAWFDHESCVRGLGRFIDNYKRASNAQTAPVTDFIGMMIGRPLTRSMAREDSPSRSDAISRLHVLHGLTKAENDPRFGRGPARRRVYHMASSGPESDHGPFYRDGQARVNWQLLEAIATVVGKSFQRCCQGVISLRSGPRYSLPYIMPMDPAVPDDWAGVSGVWLGTYSFLDYQDLFHYNFGGGSRSSLEGEIEANGDMMRLQLELVDNIEQARKDSRMKTDLPECSEPAPLYFNGVSRSSSDPAQALIGVRGRVSLMENGREVRWRFMISYGGGDQWQLEGVQPGGIRSGPIFGLWTHCSHQDAGPVGPWIYYPLRLCETLH